MVFADGEMAFRDVSELVTVWSEPASWIQRLLGLEEKLEINQLWMSS